MAKRTRADVLLVARGLVDSRHKAQALILAGDVSLADRRVTKAGELLPEDAQLLVRPPRHEGFVSRGALKLKAALDTFGLDPAGAVVADVGASTGGFTHLVLSRGAAKVFAIDVGYGQLHASLREDPRVVVMERTNARHLKLATLGEAVDWLVIDASFISLAKIFPAVIPLLKPGGPMIALVKPQFEVGPERVGKGGVVRAEALRLEAVDRACSAAARHGLAERGRVPSPIKGPKGNQEYLLWMQQADEVCSTPA